MNPDITRVISYADPTGEAAVNNPAVNDVIRSRPRPLPSSPPAYPRAAPGHRHRAAVRYAD